ncbi:MAG TPA: STAS domain-containing protein [Anaerolineales bacterium]|nr:STAS domain-containing protein [Anaerolineales bacterium]
MNITVSKEAGRVPVTILRLEGQLDGQSYQQLIDKAKEEYEAGARNFLIDMSDLTYLSSAGLVALHSIALLTSGDELPSTEQGWPTYRSMKHISSSRPQPHVKLLNPRKEVKSVLEMVGFTAAFEIFTDVEQAIQSF